MKLGGSGARCALVVTCVLALMSFGSVAHADVGVSWDCFLPSAPVECRDVAGAFFESVSHVRRGEGDGRQLSIRVRSTRLTSAERYVVDFEGTPAGQQPIAFALTEQVPDSAGRDRTMMLLVALLRRGAALYASDGEPAGSSDDGPQSGWYGRPSLSGELVSAGVRVTSVEAGFELGWTDPSWRWLTTANGAYRHLDVQLGDARLRGGFVQARARSILGRSLGAGFGVGLIGSARREPQNNLLSRAEAGVGLEWMHRELLRTDDGNFGARYLMSGVWDRYAAPTVHGQTARLYPHQSLSVFARWHLDAVDVEADVGGGLVADQPELWDVGGELSLTLRLAEAVELEISGAVIYRGGAVHEPAEPGQLDVVATTVAGSDFGELTYRSGVSIAYSFGNGLLRAQDQRWR